MGWWLRDGGPRFGVRPGLAVTHWESPHKLEPYSSDLSGTDLSLLMSLTPEADNPLPGWPGSPGAQGPLDV